MADFPTSLPSFTVTAGSETLNTAASGLGLSGLLNSFEGEITAIGTKLGTGSSVPANNTFLVGTGAGTSAWQSLTSAQLASRVSDETGTGVLVFNSSPTIVTPTIVSFVNATHNHQSSAGGGTLTGAALAANTVTFDKLALGVVVQVVGTVTSAFATGTTQIPFDDTLPQSTEGDQYMTLAISPKATSNTLLIEAEVWLSTTSASRNMSAALFQDSTANALAAGSEFTDTTATLIPRKVKVKHIMAAGTTSSTTFKIRGGANNTGTTTFNGVNGARIFGGASLSSIVITEYNS